MQMEAVDGGRNAQAQRNTKNHPRRIEFPAGMAGYPGFTP